MPEMGGLEATQTIRAQESQTARRLPIVALTAHALQGDRERCLAAGMDGYLSKPINVDELIATVERFAGDSRRRPVRAVADAAALDALPSAAANAAIFDEQAALACTGGDRRLLAHIIGLFRSDCSSALRRIQRALIARDGEALRMAAHALKGSLATLGASGGREAAAELERIGRSNRFDGADRVFSRLREQIALLDKAFAAGGLVSRASRKPVPRQRRRSTIIKSRRKRKRT